MDYKDAGPDAWPLFFFHGAPDSRLARHPDNELDGAAGARLITADRSGYGCTRRPGRRLLDWAPEVAALADTLGVERFSVMGWSAGGPSALPSRILARTGVAAVALASSPGLSMMGGARLERATSCLRREHVLRSSAVCRFQSAST